MEATWKPMEKILLEDPDFFRGQIIFQKDGYNMARRSPLPTALPSSCSCSPIMATRSLRIRADGALPLPGRSAGQRDGSCRPAAAGHGWCVAFQDNTLRPDTVLTRGSLAMLAFGCETIRQRIKLVRSGRAPFRDMAPGTLTPLPPYWQMKPAL